ncbi:cyclic nucleotide-binding domain-containing protein [Rhizobium leguminosarum bv. viciae]|nr:cyclic nucleotide-binding domain-containing protein [Rhizobium leguminosarum bv. viciae]
MITIMSDPLSDRFLELSTGKASFAGGQHIFNQDDAITRLYHVRAGAIHLVRYQADGNVAVLQRALPGMVLGEASVFSSRYHCDAVAVTNSEALVIPVNSVRRLLRSDHVFAEAWASYLSHQLQQARKRAEIASLKTVAARLSAWLAWNDGLLPSKGEWKSLADEIGVSAEALYRELAKRGKFFSHETS